MLQTQQTTKLPDKAHQLIRVGLTDLIAIKEMSDKYEIDMGVFHRRNFASGKCHVCLAGAVMSKTLCTPIDSRVSPVSFSNDRDLWCKLEALSDFAFGYILDGLRWLNRARNEILRSDLPDGVPAHIKFPAGCATAGSDDWVNVMQDMASLLEKHDL